MATGKPGIKIDISADAAAAKAALAQTATALDKTGTAAKQTAAAVEQINNTSKGLLDARAKVAGLQAELAKLKDAAIQSGQAMQRTVVQDYKKMLSSARVVVAEEREKLAQAMASKPIIIPVKPQVVTESKDPTLAAKELATSKADRQAKYLQNQLAPQFTDLVVSLQSGQNPLTVLMQQGGQIKDMYALAGKSVGQALASMARYVAGLITPVTALAAVIGVATVGFVKGRAEAEAFRDTLALSNNTIGTTVDALSNMAAAIDASSFGATQGKASDVLNQLAASGKVGADALQGVAQAAINLERVGGPAASATVEAFVSLGKEPTEALGQLNQQLGFVTRAQYEQVRALELAGDTTQAAALAQELYRQQVEKTSAKIEENLGYLELAAKATTGFFKEMWDSILGIGRVETLETQIDKVEKRLATLRRAQGMGFNRAGGADVTAAEAELAALQEQKKLRDDAAASDKAAASKNKRDQRASDIAFKDGGQLSAARAAAEVSSIKASLAAADDAYKAAYDAGLINLQGYYGARAAIIAAENAAELQELQAQLKQAQTQLAKAPLAGRAAAQAAVAAAQSRINVAGITGQGRLSNNDADRTKATKDYAAAIDALNLKLLEHAGAQNTAAAAALRRAAAEQQYSGQLGQATTEGQRASIRATIEAQVAAGNLAAAQVDKERQMQAFVQRRAEIEQDLNAGRINSIDAEQQLFSLEQQRNAVLLEMLQAMQQIPNLAADQQTALALAIQQSQNALRQMDPLMRQVTTTIRSGLEATFADALMNVRSLEDGVKALGRELAAIFARRAAAQAASGIFSAFGFAEGGHVRGPGTETSDSIPALLSDNEFVMPARAVRAYGVGFMEAVRKLQVPRSSVAAPVTVPRTARYAEGGLVAAGAAAPPQAFPVNVVVKNEGTAKTATAQTDFDGKSLVVSVLLNDIRNNGPVFRSMNSAQKSRR